MTPETETPTTHTIKKPSSFTLDYRVIIGTLLGIIVAMIFIWRPWEGRFDAQARTIEVTGDATIKATPDEYVFYPSYNFDDADRAVALAALEKKSNEVVAGLKKVGVADSAIKTNSSGYDKDGGVTYEQQLRLQPSSSSTYTLQVTVTIDNQELAQKVQDYLVSTSPTGVISPQASFSDKKRKELETSARESATKEARTKADQSSKNLGFTVGPVKSVKDGTGFGDVFPLNMKSETAQDSTSSSLSVQPGENELSYSVTVVYYLR